MYPTVSGYFSMATKKANNQNESAISQYAAVAKYANEVYNKYMFAVGEYARPLTAKEVVKFMGKCKIVLDTEKAAKDLKDGVDTKHIIEADGMQVCTTPRTVFELCDQFESMLKIKTANRVTFMHEYTPEAKDIQGVCTLPADVKSLVKCVADDKLRPVMNGVYIDFMEEKWVASDGHILQVLPAVCKATDESLRGAIIPKDFVQRHAGEEVLICMDGTRASEIDEYNRETVYAYCGKERAELIPGRYPNWKSVLPKQDGGFTIVLGDAWKEFADAVICMGKHDETGHNRVLVCGKKGETELHVVQPYFMAGVQTRHVAISTPLVCDFAMVLNGELIARMQPMQTWWMESATRAMIFNDKVCTNLVMPMLLYYKDHLSPEQPISIDDQLRDVLNEYAIDCEWKAPSHEQPADAKPEPAPAPEKPKAEAKPKSKIIETVSPTPAKSETPETPAQPTQVCETAMARINGQWEPVEEMTRTQGRVMVKRLSKPGQRAVVALADFKPAGAMIDQAQPQSMAAEETKAPVCEEQVKPETVTPDTEKPETKAEADTDTAVYVCDYSEKAIMVWGNTKKYRRELKKYGTWISKYEGWCLSKKRMEYVQKLVGKNLQAASALPAPKVKGTNTVKIAA